MKTLILSFLLMVSSAFSAVTIAVNNAAWNWSPYNWRFSGSTYAESNNPGAYAQIGFTGTSVALLVDVTPLSDQAYAAGKYPYIRHSVDNGPWTEVQLASGNTSISIATGLAAGNHTLQVGFVFIDAASTDRWTTPSGVLRITGISIDDAASAVTYTPKPRRAVWFGDSISEANWDDTDYDTGSAFETCLPMFQRELQCELGSVSFQGQGFTDTGVGNVPALYVSGNSAATAWDKLSAGNARTLSPVPNYVFCWHGANDDFGGASDGTVTARVTAWIAAARSACGPQTQIFILVPAGQYKASAIAAGVSAASDARAYLIDTGSSSYDEIADTVHLSALGHAQFFRDAWPLVRAELDATTAPTANFSTLNVGP